MASAAFARGWAAAEFDIFPAAAPGAWGWAQMAGPGEALLTRRLVSRGALARPVQLPTRGFSARRARGRTMAADCRPGG